MFNVINSFSRQYKTNCNYNIKIGKERGNSYRKIEEISGWKAHINTRKLNWNVSMITYIFLDQKRTHDKDVATWQFRKSATKWILDRKDGGKIEWKLSEVITRSVSRGQNELIGEFKWKLKYIKQYIASCATWLWNMVSYIKGEMQAKGI